MTREKTEMTFDNYGEFLLRLRGYGYEFWTHHGFMELPIRNRSEKRIILLRHDVDLDKELRAMERMIRIETELDILSTVFLRLHDPMYNVLGYREMPIIRDVIARQHEVGLHCETADVAIATGRSEREILRMDLNILTAAVGKPIKGVAAHGDISGVDNQSFIDGLNLVEFGLDYHAYQMENGGPFSGWYISNYQGNNWKRYVDGMLVGGKVREKDADFMTYADTLKSAGVQKCTFLIHPRPWHDVHYLNA